MTDEIICERRGAAGHVLLNRPAALNALTHGMVRGLADALDRWETDPDVTRVVVEGAGGKAFCAGGDIRMLYEAGKAGRHDEARAFWRDEYRLNIRIKRYAKPYVALVDGIDMGGGVGLSLHGSHLVAGDRFRFAMPEVSIGFFPDVGATYALPRLPGETGTYIALTGGRVDADDAVTLGLASAAVPSGRFEALRERLVAGEPVAAAVAAEARATAPGPIARERATIDRCFAGDTIAAVLAALDAESGAFAAETAATIRGKSPASLAIALEQLRRGKALDFEAAMALEYRVVSRIGHGEDFYEGVRATIIDKDGTPRWQHPAPDAVDRAFVDAHFAPLPDELGTA